MIDRPIFPVILAASLCLYLILKLRLSDAAQPLRLELARRGEAILANPAVPEVWQRYVRFRMDHAFGARGHLAWGILLIPFATIAVVFFKNIGVSLDLPRKADKLDLLEFCRLAEEISWFNDPVLTAVTSLEADICLVVAITAKVLFSSVAPKVEKGQVIEVVREWETSIGDKMPFAAT